MLLLLYILHKVSSRELSHNHQSSNRAVTTTDNKHHVTTVVSWLAIFDNNSVSNQILQKVDWYQQPEGLTSNRTSDDTRISNTFTINQKLTKSCWTVKKKLLRGIGRQNIRVEDHLPTECLYRRNNYFWACLCRTRPICVFVLLLLLLLLFVVDVIIPIPFSVLDKHQKMCTCSAFCGKLSLPNPISDWLKRVQRPERSRAAGSVQLRP